MNICILASGYPTKKRSEAIFVAKLADEFAELGHNVTFIAPQSITNILYHEGVFSSTSFVHKTRNGKCVNVYRPYTVSFGNSFLGRKTNAFFRQFAIRQIVKKMGDIDVYYAHFWSQGHSLYNVIKDTKKPLFVATGESKISYRNPKDGFAEYVSGVICVSTKNKEESIRLGLTVGDKCVVLPNAIDNSVFYKKDKKECRAKLGIPQDSFVVANVGTICHRKGQSRIAEAINKLKDQGIYSFFLGRKENLDISLDCPNIIHVGFVPHNVIPDYLNAADVYVFPSLAEGCSNSIVEAMSCGLPIISSDLPFNYDILDDKNSILVDPQNIDQIASAIAELKNDHQKLSAMSVDSLSKAESLTLPVRAQNIMKFISSIIK